MSRFCLILLVIITPLASSVSKAQEWVPPALPFEMEPEEGFYTDSVHLKITPLESGWEYTFNTLGRKPPNWVFPEQGITLRSSNVVRVLAVQPETKDSVEAIYTYLIDEDHELPVLSVVFEPDHFFSAKEGIYVKGSNGITGYCRSTPHNWNQDWERPVQLTLFDPSEEGFKKSFSVPAGVKIGGGCTRIYDQKSLDIYFRSEYGMSRLNYPLFPDKPITEFNRLALRNGGQDWYRAMVRNAYSQELVRGCMDLAYQSYKHVAVYFNGQYWGIHTLREKQNEDFIESNYGVDANSIDLLSGNASVGEGSAQHYQNMINYVEQNGVVSQEHFNWLNEQMDVDQYMDYLITEIFLANGDWPANNIKYWRAQADTGKWRWILYDADMTMDSHSRGRLSTNMFEKIHTTTDTDYEHPAWATLLMRKLFENEEFRDSFIQRYSVHLQLSFNPNRSLALLDSMAALIASEVPEHMRRWSKSMRLGTDMDWNKHLQVMRDFLSERPAKEREHIQSFFNTTELVGLRTTVNRPEMGIIRVEGARSDTTQELLLYKDLSARVRAVPHPGYRFVRWEGLDQSTSEHIRVRLDGASSLHAVFEQIPLQQTSAVVINEIQYHPSDAMDTGDWVELYNPSETDVDVSYWYFSDSDDAHRYYFAPDSRIPAKGFRVLSQSVDLFSSFYPNVEVVEGPMEFGFSGSGELLRLFDAQAQLIDSVRYSDDALWPAEADGQGSTLALINPGFDNAIPTYWSASSNGGTPGAPNTDVLVSNEPEESYESQWEGPKQTSLGNNYPNPFNPNTHIPFRLAEAGWVRLTIYDVLGRPVQTLVDEYRSVGEYREFYQADASSMSSGVYFYELITPNLREIKSMVLLK